MYYIRKFQPLIGTIKTLQDLFSENADEEVSTPYRDDKNTNQKILYIIHSFPCFNPL